MDKEHIETSTHKFWKLTCDVDTYRQSRQHARHDTPWNAFSPEQVLVCTLWRDQILDIKDEAEGGRVRRFVRLGGKMREWKGPAVAHGREADENLRRAAAEKLRVVGYEADPDPASLKKGERKVARFYMDRAHELQRVFGFSGADLIARLRIEEHFHDLHGKSAPIEPGYLFELVSPKGAFPVRASHLVSPDNTPDDDEEGLFDQSPPGELSNADYARLALPMLIEHIRLQRDGVLEPLTYKDLAERLNRRDRHGKPWARGLGHVLGKVTEMLDSIDTPDLEDIPYLTTIVVSSHGKNKGLPGVGISGRWHGYEALTRQEKESKVFAEYLRILSFGSRWDNVLALLRIPPSDATKAGASSAGGWGGGESDEHKALKHFVKANPHLVGAEPDWHSEVEYALRSGDEIDVFFKSARQWIGVEVKSCVSDKLDRDYERGLYQTVKYAAVLEAQAQVDHPNAPPSIRVFLVLERTLPLRLLSTAKALGVTVLENIKPIA
jgi:hypothetical protein